MTKKLTNSQRGFLGWVLNTKKYSVGITSSIIETIRDILKTSEYSDCGELNILRKKFRKRYLNIDDEEKIFYKCYYGKTFTLKEESTLRKINKYWIGWHDRNDLPLILWQDDYNNVESTTYEISTIIRLFDEGTWILGDEVVI